MMSMNINPIDLMKTIKNNPKDFIMSQIKHNSNPMIQSLIDMAERGDQKGVESFARNMCKERGINYDEKYNELIKTAEQIRNSNNKR